ncbi:hypothetical protein EZS27_007098 [termite gut metagenome]|uniref:Uncharacterized protein n=1 Tax=termite gut metagenome TaxID=433724 RepID=A0A5J4SJ75_9ZZZZ
MLIQKYQTRSFNITKLLIFKMKKYNNPEMTILSEIKAYKFTIFFVKNHTKQPSVIARYGKIFVKTVLNRKLISLQGYESTLKVVPFGRRMYSKYPGPELNVPTKTAALWRISIEAKNVSNCFFLKSKLCFIKLL